MLNDYQLEQAARHYCRLMALDPDEEVTHAHDDGRQMHLNGEIVDVIVISPRWTRHVREIQIVAAMSESVEYGSVCSKPTPTEDSE
jgi:hypothetical protein